MPMAIGWARRRMKTWWRWPALTTSPLEGSIWSYQHKAPGGVDSDHCQAVFGSMQYYQCVFLNPYTGAVTGIRAFKYDFFSIVKYIHWSLLLKTDYGQPIVGWSTLIFVLLLITGIVLWWPQKWTKAYKDRSF